MTRSPRVPMPSASSWVLISATESAEVADHGVNRSGSDLEAAREGLGAKSIDKVGAQDLVTDMAGMDGPGEEVGGIWGGTVTPHFRR